MMKKLYIYGASGHGYVIEDVAKACGYRNLEYIDDGENPYRMFDDISDKSDAEFIIAIGNNYIREQIQDKLDKLNLVIISLVHPSVFVSESAHIGKGAVVMANAVINANARIGDGVILNTGCIIEHDCLIENFVHISPNVALAGNVEVGTKTHIGIGSCVIQGIRIGDNTIIGAGSVVVQSIGSYKKAYGNPCKEINDLNSK